MLLEQIFSFLEQRSESIYLVGGCLRQRLLGLSVNDYDFVVSGQAIELTQTLSKTFQLPWFVLDQERDMARLVVNRFELDFARIIGSDLAHDLSQRDLSINAMAYPVDRGILLSHWCPRLDLLIDPMDGFADLEMRLIKGISRQNFVSDPLRLIRAFRFSARLQFELESQTLSWIQSLSERIREPAKERLTHELSLILSCENSAETCRQVNQIGLLSPILALSSEFLSLACQTLECFESVLKSDQQTEVLLYLKTGTAGERDLLCLLKLACLLGFSVGTGLNDADAIFDLNATRLDLSSLEQSLLRLFQKNIQFLFSGSPLESRVDEFRLLQIMGIHIIGLWLLFLAQPVPNTDMVSQLENLVLEWLNPGSLLAHPPQLLSGHDILKHLKQKPGPQIGMYIQSIKEAQVQGLVSDKESALNYIDALVANHTE